MNLQEVMQDKAHLKEASDIYQKFSYIADEYDDEYDDTYDDRDVGSSMQDDTNEFDKPFTIPRVCHCTEILYNFICKCVYISGISKRRQKR